MNNTWFCEFKKAPKKITVGTKLHLACEGETPLPLKDNLRIEFPDKKDLYKLHVLKTLYKEKNYVDLEVTSYRSGPFQGSFKVTDGTNSFFVENFSFSVDSVLSQTKQISKPHGPFGPWREPFPFWYIPSWIVTLILFFTLGFVVLNRFLKRKNFLEHVEKRIRKRRPSKVFIKALRKEDNESPEFVKEMEGLFRSFLENLFFYPCFG